MRRSSIIVFLLSFVSAAMLFAQTAGQQTSTKAGTTQSTTKAATPHPTAPAVLWVTTPSGLKYQDVVVGKGPQPKEGDTVVVNYTGNFTNGKVFDTSVGKRPFEFHLGRGEVIKGWDEGVGSMHVGGKRKLLIPPDLAYGQGGYPGVIPPNSTLTFDVELLKIK
jgi:FKBP-type peptidyl-prolyl cis-trans isomerase